jgi:GxxExxY protein
MHTAALLLSPVMNTTMDENALAKAVVDTAYHVHVDLGPGLLESAYEAVLARRLQKLGIKVERQKPISVQVDGVALDEGFRADLMVGDLIIVELKSVVSVSPVFSKQLKTYLKLSGKRLGLLINFGAELFKDGVTRVVLDLPEKDGPVQRKGSALQK